MGKGSESVRKRDLRRDPRGRWAEVITIEAALWKRLIQETLHGVIEMLSTIDAVLAQNPTLNQVTVCAGLYTYAVEEFGKLVLLSRCSVNNGKVDLPYAREFRDHESKFSAAIAALPSECTHIGEEGEENGAALRTTFESRLAVFYSDLTEDASGILPTPAVDGEKLRRGVSKLYDIAMKFNTS